MTIKQLWELEQLLKENTQTGLKLTKLLNTIKSIPCEETDKAAKESKSANKPKGSPATQTPEEA